MKKSIFTLALAAAMSISAYAVPNTFNYQGVCNQQNAAIEVTFTVLCDNVVVYTETQNLTTNANGAFTAVVGSSNINGGWDSIDWTAGEYVVVTSVDNDPISTATLQAVPYANVAGTVEGLSVVEDDVRDLVMANRENKTDIAEIKAMLANIDENGVLSGDLINSMLDDIEALQNGLSVVEDDVRDLVSANRENKTDIAEIKAMLENLDENGALSADLINTMLDDIETLQNGLSVVEDDVRDLVSANRENQTAIAEMQLWQANVGDNLELLTPVLDHLLEGVEANADAIEIVSSDLQGIQEKMRGLATVEALAELEAAQDEYDRQLQETLQESFNEAYELISANAQAIEYVSSDVQGIQEALRGKANVDEVNDSIDTLRRMIENNAAAIAALSAVGK